MTTFVSVLFINEVYKNKYNSILIKHNLFPDKIMEQNLLLLTGKLSNVILKHKIKLYNFHFS